MDRVRFFLAHEASSVPKRRPDAGKLPIQDASHLPSITFMIKKDVAVVEITVNQKLFVCKAVEDL
jgi:hypothetical protein